MNALPTEAIGADRIAAVEDYLTGLQDRICAAIEGVDGGARFHEDRWQRAEGGGGRSRVLRDGHVFEQAGIGFSRVEGARMPASATAHRPELADKAWVAMGVSLVFHPRNPYIPTTHMNVRMFIARGAGAPVWWFGGGFDLTPYYVFEDDARHWHEVARRATAPFGEGLYAEIVERRRDLPYGERERDFQLYRRGRYVEFNLVWDRGTLFGLQSGGRTESILMSLPPLVRWEYGYEPAPGSAEAKLTDYLKPIDWLGR